MILGIKGDKPKEYWDGLQTKEDLYNEFDVMQESTRAEFARDPEQAHYYKDGEFKAVANSLKDSVKVLLSVLPDITEHFTDSDVEMERCKTDAENILSEKFDFDRHFKSSKAIFVCLRVYFLNAYFELRRSTQTL